MDVEEKNDIVSFLDFGLDRNIIHALNEMKFNKPTLIQERTLKPILEGYDVCGSAITGSGKSAAFLIPIVQKLSKVRYDPGPKALVMSPTRELSQQLHSVFEKIAKFSHLSSALVIGGISAEEQKEKLTPPPDIIFATPGRIVDQLFNSKTIIGENIKVYVLDEADRLLSRGFEGDLTAINSKLPEDHQTLLFSATMSDQIHKIINKVLKKDAVKVAIDIFGEISPTLTQYFIKTKKEEKRLPYLVALCKNQCRSKTLVFFPTKSQAHQTSLLFNFAGIKAAELHADMPQPEREKSVELFRNGDIKILLASDLASRGLDIKDIEYVINFTIPNQIERYIHRVGRTARNGKTGTAISFVREPHEKNIQRKMEKHSREGSVAEMTIPENLYKKAIDIVNQFDEKVQAEIKKEEEERIKRAEENEIRRMKQILDIEEEIPTNEPSLDKKKKKKKM
ncbi:putative ATP-dependent RNA helicase ddx27 [Tritrichomonas musculus]|uniref:ATP-dependent RNA helicase ddx27 n=1 Tax=Tritrichomonas musculus TaxID=1915356 RepID=A0ABR2K943_9EUKA